MQTASVAYSGVICAAVMPPSTRNVDSLKNNDSSLARNDSALAISWALAKRPGGI